MTKFKKLALALLALIVTTFPQAAFAGGESNTPNPVGAQFPLLANYIDANTAGDTALDEIVTLANDIGYQLFTDSAVSIPIARAFKVKPGASYTVSAPTYETITWTGAFNGLPVGNRWAMPIPYAACTVAPCVKPAWLSTWNYFVMWGGNEPKPDTAWTTVAVSPYAGRILVSSALGLPIAVDETGKDTADTSLCKSGRIWTVSQPAWAALGAANKFAWVLRALLISLGAELSSANYFTAQSVLWPQGPADLSPYGTPYPVFARDQSALEAAWLGTVPAVQYACTLPGSMTPVP